MLSVQTAYLHGCKLLYKELYKSIAECPNILCFAPIYPCRNLPVGYWFLWVTIPWKVSRSYVVGHRDVAEEGRGLVVAGDLGEVLHHGEGDVDGCGENGFVHLQDVEVATQQMVA